MWLSRVVASLELRFNGREPDMLSHDLMDSVGVPAFMFRAARQVAERERGVVYAAGEVTARAARQDSQPS
jgi:hypothetical protein